MKILVVFVSFLLSQLAMAEKAPDSVLALVSDLEKWGTHPALIAAVKEKNSKAMTLDAIKSRDKEWRQVDGLDAGMKAMLESNVAKEMLKMEKKSSYLFESFLMDNQGANVAMTNKTSDYWQGDESKFTESYKNGAGATHIGDVEFDESAQAYLVQVSVPVMDEGKAIGAVTIGVNIDELEQSK